MKKWHKDNKLYKNSFLKIYRNSPLFLCQVFVNCMQKERCAKVCGKFMFAFTVRDVIPRMYKRCRPWFSLYFYGENTFFKFYGVFDNFSRTCVVAKSWTIKFYLCVSDVIHANEQTKYDNCGLHVNFWNFL